MPELSHFSVTLYSGVPWDENGENQVYEPNGISALLQPYIVDVIYDCTFVRRDDRAIPIRLPKSSNNWRKCNYLQISIAPGYQITGGPQVIYGFITDVQYVNDNCTYIYWHEDYFQTWVYQLEFGQCMVERASVPPETDTGVNWLLPEPIGVSMFEYDGVGQTEFNYKWHVYASEVPTYGMPPELVGQWPPKGWVSVKPGELTNEYSACWRLDADDLATVQNIIDQYTTAGMLEAIVAVFASVDIPEDFELVVKDPFTRESIHGIPVKNKKCFTYPYYSYIVSGPGFAKEYRLEKFDAGDITFKFKTIIQPNGIMIMYPLYYNHSNTQILPESVIQFGGFRQAAYSANTFTNSIAQNVPSMVLSAVSAAYTGGLDRLAFNAADTLIGLWRDSLVQNDIVQNANASSIFFSDSVIITHGFKAPSRETVRNLDDYFTAYGYNVSEIRNPMYFWNNKGNRKFVYIKTRNVEIHSKVPTAALNYISKLFNNGVRLWVEPELIGNYDLRWD